MERRKQKKRGATLKMEELKAIEGPLGDFLKQLQDKMVARKAYEETNSYKDSIKKNDFDQFKRRVDSNRKKSLIPRRFFHANLKDNNEEYKKAWKNRSKIIEYATNFEKNEAIGKCVVLYGTVGGGKTHLACGLANYLIDKGYYVVYSTLYDIARQFKSTFSESSVHKETDIIRNFSSPELLIIDEVGVQYGSETEKLILYEVINERYENFKPTLIISNHSLDEIEKLIGERVLDRLHENSGLFLHFSGESFRRIKRKSDEEAKEEND